jgi:hypothetical protein
LTKILRFTVEMEEMLATAAMAVTAEPEGLAATAVTAGSGAMVLTVTQRSPLVELAELAELAELPELV